MKLIAKLFSALAMPVALLLVTSLLGTPASQARTKVTKKHHASKTSRNAKTSKTSKTHKTPAARATSLRSPKKTRSRRQPRKRGQQAPTTDRISEIQTALAKDGSYIGEPTGKWDSNTVDAMRRFQAAQGLNPSGKLDALTLQKLGLGSKISGVAAPLPVTSPSAATPPAAAPTQTSAQSQ
jgi:peptidoglycan hydrolase-like protein with peptidoglycan-binding domain